MRHRIDGVLDLAVPDHGGAPLILDSPHSGREHPDDFQPLIAPDELRRVEDAYVDQLFARAPEFGAVLLSALFPRTYIDANRAASDVDPTMLRGRWHEPPRPTEKSRLGHGLVWKSFPPDRPLYAGRLPVEHVRARVEGYWRPYHEALETEIHRLRAVHGAVWHLNCHSMPSSSSPFVPGRAGARADFVLGDRDGSSCDRGFTLFARDVLERMGYSVRLNDPYRGAELVRAYSDPANGRHSLQIEINRALYLNEDTLEPNEGFDALRESLTRLVSGMVDYCRDALRPAAEAAE
jgi:N-formylglutamate deformylase